MNRPHSRPEAAFCALFIAFLLFVSCDTGANPDSTQSSTKNPAITSVSWEILDIDPSYKTTSTEELLLGVQGTYNDDVTESDIVSYKLISPTGQTRNYSKDSGTSVINAKKKTFEARNSSNSFELGTYTLSLTLVGGKTITKDFLVTEPGTTAPSTKTSVTLKTTLGENEVSALRRPTIALRSRTASSITLSVYMNDAKVSNVTLNLFNSQSVLIGSCTGYFYDLNGSPASFVTVEGNELTCTITSSQVSLTAGATIADIAKVGAITFDGTQYPSMNKHNYVTLGPITAL